MKHLATANKAKVIDSKKVRFVLVGGANTLVDFAILNILVSFFAAPLIVANIISTTTAMVVSFGLNKKTVFKSQGNGIRQVVLFFAVTLTGIWLVQSSVLLVVHQLLAQSGLNKTIQLNVAKLVGIGIGLIWNYIWYNRVVFKEKDYAKDK